MMILTDHEVKTCLVYVLTPILQKYSIEIKEAHLAIHDVIELNAILLIKIVLLILQQHLQLDIKIINYVLII